MEVVGAWGGGVGDVVGEVQDALDVREVVRGVELGHVVADVGGYELGEGGGGVWGSVVGLGWGEFHFV